MNKLFFAQASNNAWANFRLGKACAQLSDEALSQERESFFGSIIATLNHILIVDWFYVSALEGQCIGPSAFDELVPFPGIGQLIDAQSKIDARLMSVCAHPDEDLASRPVEMIRRGRRQIERFDRTFLHLIQHQIHHRGQVHGLLSATNVSPPQLDEFYMAWEPDQKMRAPDFAAMGLSEQEIWAQES